MASRRTWEKPVSRTCANQVRVQVGRVRPVSVDVPTRPRAETRRTPEHVRQAVRLILDALKEDVG